MSAALYNIRLGVLGFLLALAFAALSFRLYQVQVQRHEELREKARIKVTAVTHRTGNRGQIFDCKGRLLAGNRACRDVLVEPRLFAEDAAATEVVNRVLSTQLGVSRAVLREKFAQAFRPVRPQVEIPVFRGLDLEKAKALQDALVRDRGPGKKPERIPGIRFVDTNQREYPKGMLAAGLIGLVDFHGVGVSGIEKLYQAKLKPGQTQNTIERDRKGRIIPASSEKPTRPPDGWNVTLTIDEAIQHIVERELQTIMEKHQPKSACAIMVDPRTGAVLAYAQLPGFDPNLRGNIPLVATQNPMVYAGFEPGSIMKSVTVCGALDAKLVTLKTAFDCENGLWLYHNRTLKDSHRYGTLTVAEIIQKSSNIGTAKISLLLGEERLYNLLRAFGFGEPTGIGFPNESRGIFAPWQKWDGLKVTRVPIGQGVLVTPVQMVQAYCALANGGALPQLRLVERLENPSDGEILRFPATIRRRVASPEAVVQTVQAMKLVTEKGGTATTAAVPGFKVAGKTGTAQKAIIGARGYSNNYVSSFIGFVPADNPAFVLLVTVDEPSRNGYYGGTVAGPAFSRISKQTLELMQIPPTHSLEGDGQVVDPAEPTVVTVPGYDEVFEEDYFPEGLPPL